MTSLSPTLLRTTTRILFWAMALVLALGPQRPLVVCTAECCAEIEAPVPDHCSCCEHAADAAPTAHGTCVHPQGGGADEGDGEVKGRCRTGCCVDLSLHLGTGPLPRHVDVPAVDAAWTLGEPDHPAPQGHGWAQWIPVRDVRPPRADRRTELLASTILRL